MSLFDKPVDCDECGAQFVVDDSRIGSIKKDDLEVQYLSCPSCGAKFLIFVSDSKMRVLVERRKAIQAKIKVARANMPLLQNVPTPSNEGWQLTTCPECGRECWYQTNNAELLKSVCPETIFLCTECALTERWNHQ